MKSISPMPIDALMDTKSLGQDLNTRKSTAKYFILIRKYTSSHSDLNFDRDVRRSLLACNSMNMLESFCNMRNIHNFDFITAQG